VNLFPANGQTPALPTFICVGAEKSGSTYLYDCLRRHPNIYMSPIKETHFFSTDVQIENFRQDYQRHEAAKRFDTAEYFAHEDLPDEWEVYIRKPEHYLRLFAAGKPYLARGEVCNSYIYSSEAAGNIADSLPGVRVLVMLRNPVDRAISHVQAMQRDGRTHKNTLRMEIEHDRSFSDRRWGSCHGYIDHGMYADQLKRLFSVFNKEDVMVVLADDFFQPEVGILNAIFEFIGVPADTPGNQPDNRNLSRKSRSAWLMRLIQRSGLRPAMAACIPDAAKASLKTLLYSSGKESVATEDKQYLLDIYSRQLDELEQLLERDLTFWKKI